MKIDWKRKLTSRKFWFALAGLATGILVMITAGVTEERLAGAVMTLGSIVAYIIGEGLADSANGGDKGGS
jgi:hypothetical protein